MYKTIFLVLSAVWCCYGQIIQDGQCDPDVPLMDSFEIYHILGRWYEIARTENPYQNGDCSQLTLGIYSTGEDNEDIITVNNEAVNNNFFEKVNGTGIQLDDTAKLELNLSSLSNPIDFWIILTDGSSFAIGYKCINIGETHRGVYLWLLGRQTSYTNSTLAYINRHLNNTLGVTSNDLKFLDHSENACHILPEIEEGEPILLPGSCDPNVTAIPNFDLTKFSGLWHEIASYETESLSGTCSRTEYSTSGNFLNVNNNFVVNQTLGFISGSAYISADGSAELYVLLTNGDVYIEQEMWVIATDYDSYALSYFCEDLPNNQKRVYSWIHSRTRQLSPPSESAVNDAINTIMDLNQRYYQETKRSDEDCFYYPDPDPNQPVIFRGACDLSIPVVFDFNLQDYLGLWHVIESYPSVLEIGTCNNAEYSDNNGTSLAIYNTQVINQTLDSINGAGTYSEDESAKMVMSFPNEINVTTINYWVLATDYQSYALVYSCQNIDNGREVFSWKLSRTKSLTSAAQTAITNTINSIPVLEQRYYQPRDQTPEGCFYFPDPQPGQTVMFPGQCDETIPVLNNFDLSQFAGRWFDIESYYEPTQTGTCNDASFSLFENTFEIENTQVINEELDTISTQATLASDGSAKLTVTSTVNGNTVTREYWILDTDYDSYALIYSCQNVDSENRHVRSWKLSRTRYLSNTSSEAIDNIINSINVLDDRFYQAKDHSEQACFYYPEPVPGQVVVFRGQCNERISTVENFDLERYSGIWFDVESYPQDVENGTCSTAEYNINDGVLEVYNTQVVNLQLASYNGTAEQAPGDTSAKLILNFPNETIPYWVLATDYDNYALVYSCLNLNDEYYRVTTWKLSREKSLSENSVAAINNTMSNVQVLRQQYFELNGHSEDDCFYYPYNYGGPVIQRGVCDSDDQINVIENFNIAAFAGTWHEAARFPSELQIGECVANEYVISGQGNSFSIAQTIVNDERLTTIAGAGVVSNDSRGIIRANFINSAGNTTTINLYILDIEYDEFALVYSCRNVGENSKQIYSWKLSRPRSGLSDSINERIDETVWNTRDLFEPYYENTDQSYDACFYYPFFDETPPFIELPGPCDERIPAKANFDVDSYLGRWFEIAKYPIPLQVGECARAHYNSENGDIEVVNTIVYNRTLESIAGSATISSADNSGLLNVTFVVDGEIYAVNYYVLETDYDNFAMVYTCLNLENGNSQVFSWILSRERTLSEESNNAINNVITNTRGLLEDYYISISQSDEDCFYVPELNVNQGVVFRGQCEEISGVPEFDVQRYLGWWHEIERFPSDVPAGECISSRYEASGDEYQVVETKIYGVTAIVNTSSLQVTSDGKLTRTLSNGETLEMWVLATDYDSYAFIYSCENIDSEYRRVWSAKHSKTRQLSETDQDIMTPIIENNEVLYPQFYLPVNQGNDACFHYPETNGEVVILPGQCDTNIPVVQNFQLSHYTGTWYEIERYPRPGENGTCVGSRYNFNEQRNDLEVINWYSSEDGILNTIEGRVTSEYSDGRLTVVLSVPDSNITLTTQLYVLATDYVSYSLTYTCTNVDEYYRAVGAWKLSRMRTMSNNTNIAINTAMNQIQELHQPYFIPVYHDDTCEDPNGALVFNSSIILVLLCVIIQLFK